MIRPPFVSVLPDCFWLTWSYCRHTLSFILRASDMRIFLFIISITSLLLATRQFSLAEQTGQYKGALFLLLIGIQLLIAAALISEHREERTRKSSTSTNRGNSKAAGAGAVNESVEEGKAVRPVKE